MWQYKNKVGTKVSLKVKTLNWSLLLLSLANLAAAGNDLRLVDAVIPQYNHVTSSALHISTAFRTPPR